jgi:hypothetical protein
MKEREKNERRQSQVMMEGQMAFVEHVTVRDGFVRETRSVVDDRSNGSVETNNVNVMFSVADFCFAFDIERTMVEIKLCIVKMDGNSEYRRITIPHPSMDQDLLAILREKLRQLYPELNNPSDGINVEFQYEGDLLKKTCSTLV